MMELVRGGCAQVQPLEVWNLDVGGKPIWRSLGAGAVESRLDSGELPSDVGRSIADVALRFAEKLRRGEFESMDDTIEGYSKLYFCGGLTRVAGFRSGVDESTDRCWIMDAARDVLAGGRQVIREYSVLSGAAMVVDVGQTAIKTGVLDRGGTVKRVRRFERPWSRLPVWLASENRWRDSRQHPSGQSVQVERLVEFVSRAVTEGLAKTVEPISTLVLALPCELGEKLEPGACSYGDWTRVPDLVTRIAEAIEGLPSTPQVIALNDAELAGLAVLELLEGEGLQGEDALVLSLGFGPGAAYVDTGASNGDG